jgi:hypothetical protein
MLFGDGTLTYMQNLTIFKSVQLHLNEENVLPIYDRFQLTCVITVISCLFTSVII